VSEMNSRKAAGWELEAGSVSSDGQTWLAEWVRWAPAEV
jgi:hypothetical protein